MKIDYPWNEIKWNEYKMSCNIPNELDGHWLIFTDGKEVSIERYKMDCEDHFLPNGRYFELQDAIAWQPLPKWWSWGNGKD